MFQGFAMNAWLCLKINQWWVIILSHTHTHIYTHKKITLVPFKQHECKNGVSFLIQEEVNHLRLLVELESLLHTCCWATGQRKQPWVGFLLASFFSHPPSSFFLFLPSFLLPSFLHLFIHSFLPSFLSFFFPSFPHSLSPCLISPAVFSPWNLTFFFSAKGDKQSISIHGHLWSFHHCVKFCNLQ